MRLIFQRSSMAAEVSENAAVSGHAQSDDHGAASADQAMLARYAETGSEDAFAQIVYRHAGWIYNTCRRSLHDSHLAEDATQAVFLLLSRKAASLKPSTHVAGWLFQTCRYVLADLRKNRARYKRRQEIARDMSLRRFFEAEGGQPAADPELLGALDEAISRLRDGDRQVILMHFYEGLTVHQIAEQLGLGSETAKKRVTRALGRLRSQFGGNGMLAAVKTVTLPAAALSALLYAAGAKAAPAGLTAAVVKATTVPGLSSLIADMIVAGVRQATMHATGKLLAALAVTAAPLAVVVAVKQPAHPDRSSSAPLVAVAPSPRFSPAIQVARNPGVATVTSLPGAARFSYGVPPWTSPPPITAFSTGSSLPNANGVMTAAQPREFQTPSSAAPMAIAAAPGMSHASKASSRFHTPPAVVSAPAASYPIEKTGSSAESPARDRDRHAEAQATAEPPGPACPTSPGDGPPPRPLPVANAGASPTPWEDGMLRHPAELKFIPLEPEDPQPRMGGLALRSDPPPHQPRFISAPYAEQPAQPPVPRLIGSDFGWHGDALGGRWHPDHALALSDPHPDGLPGMPLEYPSPSAPQPPDAVVVDGGQPMDLRAPGLEHRGLSFGGGLAMREREFRSGRGFWPPPEMSAFSLATDDRGESPAVGFSAVIPEPATGIWALLAGGFLLHRRRTRRPATSNT